MEPENPVPLFIQKGEHSVGTFRCWKSVHVGVETLQRLQVQEWDDLSETNELILNFLYHVNLRENTPLKRRENSPTSLRSQSE